MPQVTDETKLTAHLPHLDVEITRRLSPGQDAEMVTISLKATPNLEAAAALLAPQLLSALPGLMAQTIPSAIPSAFLPASFAGAPFGMPFPANPVELWMKMGQAMMAPWLAPWQTLAGAANPFLTPQPFLTPRQD